MIILFFFPIALVLAIVFATFKHDPQEAGANWSRWYKLLTEKINSGDIYQVAEVVRDLTYAQQIAKLVGQIKVHQARIILQG